MPIILAIDPGINGGVARLDTQACTLSCIRIPSFSITRSKTSHWVDLHGTRAFIAERMPDHAWIEEVRSSPQMGVVGAFSFGAHYSGVKGLLVGLGIPFSEERPAVWKAKLRAPANKTESRSRASELFPACAHYWRKASDDGLAEAAMIALYGAIQLNCMPSKPIQPETK